jgi:hypothetical protein
MSLSNLLGSTIFTKDIGVGLIHVFNGGDTANPINVTICKMDRLCIVQIESFNITSTSDGNTSCSSTIALPIEFRPSNQVLNYGVLFDVNGGIEMGHFAVLFTGIISFGWQTALDNGQVINVGNTSITTLSYIV